MGVDSAVFVAVISLAGTLIGSWMGVRQANRLVNWRIDKLEEKVDRHNNLVERMAVAEKDIKAAHKRIDSIEGKKGKEISECR